MFFQPQAAPSLCGRRSGSFFMRHRLPVLVLMLALAAPVGRAATPSTDPAAAPAGHYVLDHRHASVLATVLHLGLSHYTMRLDQFDAVYDYDPVNPAGSKLSVTLDARSLDTGDAGISHQFADQFLDAEQHPEITFVSTAIQPTDPGHGVVTGDLTFRGVTRPASLQVTYNGSGYTLIGGQRMGFSATTVIKRSDFGSKAWLGEVGDDVRLVIEAEFVRR